MYAYITLTTIIHVIFACQHYHDPACRDVKPIDGDHFMNQFIAEIEGGEEMAKQVARDIGFEYKKPVKTHVNYYYFTHPDVYDRHKKRHEDVLKILREHEHVEVADQQYVWQPTIRELEMYEDMVGLEEPLEVRTSHFNPDEIECEGKTAYELIRPDDVFREPEPIQNYPPIHTIVDFDKLYEEKNREKEKRAQKRLLQEERKKKQEEEAERNATAKSGTSKSDVKVSVNWKINEDTETPQSEVENNTEGVELATQPATKVGNTVEEPGNNKAKKVKTEEDDEATVETYNEE